MNTEESGQCLVGGIIIVCHIEVCKIYPWFTSSSTLYNKISIEYVYSADGIKLKVRHITAVPQDGTGSSSSSGSNYILSRDSIDYIGDFVYRKNRFSRYNWEDKNEVYFMIQIPYKIFGRAMSP